MDTPAEPVLRKTAGGIVLGDGGTIALIRHSGGSQSYGFPKGGVEENETDEETARREILEETGLPELEYIDDLGTYERPTIGADGLDVPGVLKSIHMFLFAAPMHTKLAPHMEIQLAEWVSFREAVAVLTHPKDRAWFSSVASRIQEAIQRD